MRIKIRTHHWCPSLDRFGPGRGYQRRRLRRSSQLRILRKSNLVI